MARLCISVVFLAFGLACSDDGRGRPAPRDGGTGTDDGGTGSIDGSTGVQDARTCTPAPEGEGSLESCSNGMDDDCDGAFDCSDVDCSGVGSCPICGQIDTPLSSPLALPDGVGDSDCTTDADCPGTQQCYEIENLFATTMECRDAYRSTLSFIGFGGAVFDSVDDIQSVCVEMEHSFLRDLEITLEAPGGQQVRLQRFLGQEGGEIYLGQADDCDDDGSPSPGTGARYCWTPTSSRDSMLDYANAMGALDSAPSCLFGDVDMMPPGDYSAADDWSNLIGTPLNGDWTLSVTDLWPLDNGYIFEWSIAFDPNTVEDCGSPLI